MDTIHVLHVEDDPALRDLAATALGREAPIEVTPEGDPDTALDRVTTGTFDCIVSDYEMPGTNGLELLRAVRETDQDLPFILFTGKGSEEIASEAISAGVDDYIQKKGGTEQFELLANRVENVVDRRRAERRRAESERRLSTLLGNVPGMAYRCRNEPDWPMEFVSDGCEELTGYTAAELTSDEVVWGEDVLHPDEQGDFWEPVQQALDDREAFEVTYRIRTADGETKWCWERGRGVYADEARPDDGGADLEGDAADQVVALEGFISDVTERKHIEDELRALNDKVGDLHVEARRLAEADSVAAVWERAVAAAESVLAFETCYVCEAVDGGFRTRAASNALDEADLMAPAADEGITARTYKDGDPVLVTDARDRADAVNAGEDVRASISVPVGDLGVFQAVSSTPGAFDEDDLELAALLMDHVAAAVERVRSNERLRAERDRFAALFEQVPDPAVIATYDEDNQPVVRSVNPAFEDVFGYDAATVEGHRLNDFIVPDDRGDCSADIDDRVVAGGQVEREVTRTTADGERRDFLFRSVTVEDDPIVGFGVYTDITERERYRTRLERQNERLDAFARVVSHDLRTPLNVATGNMDIAAQNCDDPHIDEARGALEQMEALIEDVLALARSSESVETAPVPLAGVARSVWDALDAPVGSLSIAVPDDHLVLASEDALSRLLENLFRNATEHGSTSPPQTGDAGEADEDRPAADEAGVDVVLGVADDGFYVADDGPGVPESDREKVFEQGETLDDDGTGIGLAVVEQVARAHGWSVGLAESADGGARFTFEGVDQPS